MQSTVNSLHSLLLRTGSFRDTETVLWFSQREISDAYNLVNGNTSETSLWSFKRTFARFSVVQDSFCIAGVNSASSKTGNCRSVLSSGRFWVCYVLMTHPQWVVWQHFYKLNVKKIYSLVAADWSYLKWKLAGWQTLQALLHKIFRSVKVKSSWGTLKKKIRLVIFWFLFREGKLPITFGRPTVLRRNESWQSKTDKNNSPVEKQLYVSCILLKILYLKHTATYELCPTISSGSVLKIESLKECEPKSTIAWTIGLEIHNNMGVTLFIWGLFTPLR